MRTIFAAAAMPLCLLGNGCMVLLGNELLPTHVVVADTGEKTQTVEVNSEPPGAQIVDGRAPATTTPGRAELTYGWKDLQKRRYPCLAMIPLGLIDISAGVVGVWAYASGTGQRLWAADEKGVFWAAEGLIVAPAYAIAALGLAGASLATWCDDGGPETVDVPRDNQLRLVYEEWEEPLTVRAPVAEPARITAVIREKEEVDWRQAQAYDNVGAYWYFYTTYPSGRWRGQARRAILSIFDSSPDRIQEGILADMVLDAEDSFRTVALREVLRRHGTGALVEALTRQTASPERRLDLVRLLETWAAEAGRSPEQAAELREALCRVSTIVVPVSVERIFKCAGVRASRECFRVEPSRIAYDEKGNVVAVTISNELVHRDDLNCVERVKREQFAPCATELQGHEARVRRAAGEAGNCPTPSPRRLKPVRP